MRAVISSFKSGLTSTKFWKVASVWLICLFYLLFQGGKTSFMLFAMVSILAAYLVIGGFSGVKRIKGTRTLSLEGDRGHLQAGDQVQVKLVLNLPQMIPLPYIVVREMLRRHNGQSWAFEDSVIPLSQGKASLLYQTPPLERGKYVFSSTECISRDIFGLMENKGEFQTDGKFHILPRTIFIPYWQLYSKNSRLAGPEMATSLSRREATQINGVRDYVYGDRISRIHWNATAKTGTWKSKEFEHESLPKTMLVLDAHAMNYKHSEQFELAVSTVTSLLQYGARERISMGLCTLGKNFRSFAPAENYLERQQMIHHMVDIHNDGVGKHRERLEANKQCFPSEAFFILISPMKDDQALSIMNWVKGRQMIPYHIQIGVPNHATETRSRTATFRRSELLSERGVKGTYVSSLQDLPAAMGGRRHV